MNSSFTNGEYEYKSFDGENFLFGDEISMIDSKLYSFGYDEICEKEGDYFVGIFPLICRRYYQFYLGDDDKKVYYKKVVLKELVRSSLSVTNNKYLCFFGASGTGKTTSMIATLKEIKSLYFHLSLKQVENRKTDNLARYIRLYCSEYFCRQEKESSMENIDHCSSMLNKEFLKLMNEMKQNPEEKYVVLFLDDVNYLLNDINKYKSDDKISWLDFLICLDEIKKFFNETKGYKVDFVLSISSTDNFGIFGLQGNEDVENFHKKLDLVTIDPFNYKEVMFILDYVSRVRFECDYEFLTERGEMNPKFRTFLLLLMGMGGVPRLMGAFFSQIMKLPARLGVSLEECHKEHMNKNTWEEAMKSLTRKKLALYFLSMTKKYSGINSDFSSMTDFFSKLQKQEAKEVYDLVKKMYGGYPLKLNESSDFNTLSWKVVLSGCIHCRFFEDGDEKVDYVKPFVSWPLLNGFIHVINLHLDLLNAESVEFFDFDSAINQVKSPKSNEIFGIYLLSLSMFDLKKCGLGGYSYKFKNINFELKFEKDEVKHMEYLGSSSHRISFPNIFNKNIEYEGWDGFIEKIMKCLEQPGVIFYFLALSGSSGPDGYAVICIERRIQGKLYSFVFVQGLKEKMTEHEVSFSGINFLKETVKGGGCTNVREKLEKDIEAALRNKNTTGSEKRIYVNYRFLIYFDHKLKDEELDYDGKCKEFYKKKIKNDVRLLVGNNENLEKTGLKKKDINKLEKQIFRDIDDGYVVAESHSIIGGVGHSPLLYRKLHRDIIFKKKKKKKKEDLIYINNSEEEEEEDYEIDDDENMEDFNFLVKDRIVNSISNKNILQVTLDSRKRKRNVEIYLGNAFTKKRKK